MEPENHRSDHTPTVAGSLTLLTVIVVIAVMYFARVVFIPLALAILLAFLLGPLVVRLRRWGLGKMTATMIVVSVTFLFMLATAGLVSIQLSDLAKKLPEYRQNVREKLTKIRSSGGGMVTQVSSAVQNLSNELIPKPPTPPPEAPPEEKPVPVEIREAPFSPLEVFQKVLGSVLELGIMGGVVIVFVIFMLVQREDLRDRFLRLLGTRRVHLTTRAIDDAAGRMSRFLLAQFILNISYGIPVGIGLYFIDVPNPILWGILAGLLRYVPYLGIWVAAIMPAILAFAVDPGWVKVPLIFALFFGIDLVMYNFAEPLLYGSSTGISPMAILVATVFWTWLWGPVGLLLATPLTVCVVVIGRHVPSLEFLSIMLSDQPVLRPETRFYQRMLAQDMEEALGLAEEYVKKHTLEDFYEAVAIPALILAEEDRHSGKLGDEQQVSLTNNMRVLLEDLAERADDLAEEKREPSKEVVIPASAEGAGEHEVLCIPARDSADEMAGIMVAQILRRRGVGAKALSAQALAGESLQEVTRAKTRIVCVTAIPPSGYMHTRYICRRLRAHHLELRLVAAFLTQRDLEELRRRRPPIVADELATTLKQALAAVQALLPGSKSSEGSKELEHPESEPAPQPARA